MCVRGHHLRQIDAVFKTKRRTSGHNAVAAIDISVVVREPGAVRGIGDLKAQQVGAVEDLLFERVKFRVRLLQATVQLDVCADAEAVELFGEAEALRDGVVAGLPVIRNGQLAKETLQLVSRLEVHQQMPLRR